MKSDCNACCLHLFRWTSSAGRLPVVLFGNMNWNWTKPNQTNFICSFPARWGNKSVTWKFIKGRNSIEQQQQQKKSCWLCCRVVQCIAEVCPLGVRKSMQQCTQPATKSYFLVFTENKDSWNITEGELSPKHEGPTDNYKPSPWRFSITEDTEIPCSTNHLRRNVTNTSFNVSFRLHNYVHASKCSGWCVAAKIGERC